jgi:hypothetical protein
MNIAENLLPVTADNLYSFVNNASIFSFYMNSQMKFNTPFSSPFRADKNPSFIIYERGFFVDFASGEKGNAITFVMKLYKLNFNNALLLIIRDQNLVDRFNCLDSFKDVVYEKANFNNARSTVSLEGGSEINVKRRDFNQDDRDYWGKYNLDENDLNSAKIIPISHFFIGLKMFIAEKLSYAFMERKDGVITIKIYQPNSSYLKWINNNNGSVWEMWEQLPRKAETVIITSSRKDALCVIKNLSIASTAFQSETTIPKESVMNEIFERFENVYLLMDNDFNKEKNWGQEAADKLIQRFSNLTNIVIPSETECKDFSDLCFKYGHQEASEILMKVILQSKQDQLCS